MKIYEDKNPYRLSVTIGKDCIMLQMDDEERRLIVTKFKNSNAPMSKRVKLLWEGEPEDFAREYNAMEKGMYCVEDAFKNYLKQQNI